MTKYVLEADLSDGCWNCPCEGEGWCCQAADYRATMPDDAGELPDDYIPEWCPLVPLGTGRSEHMAYDEFSDRASVVTNVRPEDGMLVVGVTIGAVFKPMRGPCETGIPEDEYVDRCKRRFYDMLFGGGNQCEQAARTSASPTCLRSCTTA